MIEAASTKVLAQPLGQALVLTEHYALDHASAHTAEAGYRGTGQPRMELVGEAFEPAATSDYAPFLRPQHGVNPVSAEPGALVEAMRRAARGTQFADESDAGTQRRCTAEWQFQQHRFARTKVAPAQDDRTQADLERASTRGLLDLHDGALCGADERGKHAPVDCAEASAPPAPAGDCHA